MKKTFFDPEVEFVLLDAEEIVCTTSYDANGENTPWDLDEDGDE